MLVVLIRRHWICRETKFGVERHASFLACIACCFLWNYRFILESRATSSSCSFFMFHLGSGSTMVLKGSLWLKALVWYFYSIFRTEQSFVLYEGIFIGTGAGFHHPECALHQFGSFSTIQRHLPITGASILFFFFFLFWEPVLPSFRKVMRRHCHFGRLLPAKRTRALPLPDSDSPPLLSRVISPDDSPASRMPSLYFLAPRWLCCPIFCAFLRSKSAALPPVSTLEPW